MFYCVMMKQEKVLDAKLLARLAYLSVAFADQSLVNIIC